MLNARMKPIVLVLAFAAAIAFMIYALAAEVRVNVGDIVRKGQVLAVFAAESVNADIAQARATLQEAQANVVCWWCPRSSRMSTISSTGSGVRCVDCGVGPPSKMQNRSNQRQSNNAIRQWL
jgi:multidrug efflux pump subunit AcrA (membrane-fusion protein)